MSKTHFAGGFGDEPCRVHGAPALVEARLTNSSAPTFDVVIAGAGIVGAACAWQLSKAGLSVGITDAAFVGSGATAAGMGHIVVMDDSEAQFRLTSWSRQLWHEVAAELPARAEYAEGGTLWVASNEAELAEAERKRDYASSRGVDATLVNAQELSALEPRLRPGLAGALLVPHDALVYAPVVARWMLAQAVSRGAIYHPQQGVESFGAGKARLADGTLWSAAALVNAAGVDAPRLTPGLPIQARKGHLAITDRAPGFIAHQIVELGYLKSAHSPHCGKCGLQPLSAAHRANPDRFFAAVRREQHGGGSGNPGSHVEQSLILHAGLGRLEHHSLLDRFERRLPTICP